MKNLKEQRGDATIVLLIIIMLILIAGFGALFYTTHLEMFNRNSEVDTSNSIEILNGQDGNKQLTNNVKRETTTSQSNTIQFSDFAKLLKTTDDYSSIKMESNTSYISEIILSKGNIFLSTYNENVTDPEGKNKINSLKKEKIYLEDDEHDVEVYKTVLKDIILAEAFSYGADGTLVLICENDQGEVFYHVFDQSASDITANGEIEFKKSKNLQNIIYFRQRGLFGTNVYGVDIKGNEIAFTD